MRSGIVGSIGLSTGMSTNMDQIGGSKGILCFVRCRVLTRDIRKYKKISNRNKSENVIVNVTIICNYNGHNK